MEKMGKIKKMGKNVYRFGKIFARQAIADTNQGPH
jgi:hypothetical protein